MLFSSKEILAWRIDQLSRGGRAVDLDWLLDIGAGLGWDALQKVKIFQNGDYILAQSLEDLSLIWETHLKEQIPLQHLVGKCPWRDFEIQVNSSVLIPRQESEILIELALQKFQDTSNGCWADLGTGSGVLAIALAKELPNWSGYGVDCSNDALRLAKKNLESLIKTSKVHLLLGNWWEPLRPIWGKLDLVIANPPYIPNSLLKTLHPLVRDHEPHVALDGGMDGMESIRVIVDGAMQGLCSGGWLIFEHHFDQSQRALDYLLEAGLVEVDFQKDIEGVRRFAFGRHP
ncbi:MULTISPECIES: peptide chain release factor N(5)-glutamine methyltransferase [Prochlorococcus]|uniref:peptide chain release factor N(5)-glutamine methyltransferase n=1 Tax=Prochlorococcus TaxID=1218 RepID=UPI000533A0C6|nr:MULTISPECIES: peptide chain release factor N(5)-glutamine methyltransferase [Prochlorococcus]KGG13037.1 Protein-N(5)-glutamine methyltransferase PrmC [Prochlorococcus sp. MIT 0601]